MTTDRIITPPFRVSFPSVFKPSAVPGSDAEPKYSVVMLFPKDDPEVGKFIKKVKSLLASEIKDKWSNKKPKKLNLCLADGDSEDELDASDGTTEGYWILKGTSKSRPEVIERNGDPCTPETFYPGVWSRASIVFRAYDKGSNGVACHFNNFLKWKDDEPFGQGKRKASDDFEEFLNGDDYDDDENDGEDLDI